MENLPADGGEGILKYNKSAPGYYGGAFLRRLMGRIMQISFDVLIVLWHNIRNRLRKRLLGGDILSSQCEK